MSKLRDLGSLCHRVAGYRLSALSCCAGPVSNLPGALWGAIGCGTAAVASGLAPRGRQHTGRAATGLHRPFLCIFWWGEGLRRTAAFVAGPGLLPTCAGGVWGQHLCEGNAYTLVCVCGSVGLCKKACFGSSIVPSVHLIGGLLLGDGRRCTTAIRTRVLWEHLFKRIERVGVCRFDVLEPACSS